jgi:hypothetical protein
VYFPLLIAITADLASATQIPAVDIHKTPLAPDQQMGRSGSIRRDGNRVAEVGNCGVEQDRLIENDPRRQFDPAFLKFTVEFGAIGDVVDFACTGEKLVDSGIFETCIIASTIRLTRMPEFEDVGIGAEPLPSVQRDGKLVRFQPMLHFGRFDRFDNDLHPDGAPLTGNLFCNRTPRWRVIGQQRKDERLTVPDTDAIGAWNVPQRVKLRHCAGSVWLIPRHIGRFRPPSMQNRRIERHHLPRKHTVIRASLSSAVASARRTPRSVSGPSRRLKESAVYPSSSARRCTKPRGS